MIIERLSFPSFSRLASELSPAQVQVTKDGFTAYFPATDRDNPYLRLAPCLMVVRDGSVYRVRGVDLSTARRRVRIARSLKPQQLRRASVVHRGPKADARSQ